MKTKVSEMKYQAFSPFFSSYGFRCSKDLNPFLNLDIFNMSQPTFPPHPHAGFSAVTYLFPSSQGSFKNRDSNGDNSIIEPGGLHWTQADHGMLHEEIPIIPGINSFGLQMFIKTPIAKEEEQGKAFHLSPSEIQTFSGDGYIVRLLTGEYNNQVSMLTKIHPLLNFLDIELDKTKSISLNSSLEKTTLLVCIKGSIEIEKHNILKQNEVFEIQESDILLKIIGVEASNQFLFLSADSLKEDYFWNGPFCLSTQAKLIDARERFQSGKMGYLSPSF